MYDFSNKPPNFLDIISLSSEYLFLDYLEDNEETGDDEQ